MTCRPNYCGCCSHSSPAYKYETKHILTLLQVRTFERIITFNHSLPLRESGREPNRAAHIRGNGNDEFANAVPLTLIDLSSFSLSSQSAILLNRSGLSQQVLQSVHRISHHITMDISQLKQLRAAGMLLKDFFTFASNGSFQGSWRRWQRWHML